MTKTIEAKRIVALLGLAMAVLLVLSALGASDAEAKKKKHHHKPPPTSLPNVVHCPNGSSDSDCSGTAGNDHLLGRDDKFDDIQGGEGNDIYDGKGGSDRWADFSATSNDTYLVPSTEFSQLSDGVLDVDDRGGGFDVLDLSAYKSTDFALSRDNASDGLFMFGPEKRGIFIENFFTTNSIDLFKFSDGIFTAEQIKSKV